MRKTSIARRTLACVLAAGVALVPCIASNPASAERDTVEIEDGTTVDALDAEEVENTVFVDVAYAKAKKVKTDNPWNSYNAGAATKVGDVQVDASKATYGYIGIKGSNGSGSLAGHRLKVQITLKSTYTYDLSTDGNPNYYPLNQGNGSYSVNIFRNVDGNRYASVGSTKVNAKMLNAHQPFMHGNIYCNYVKSSKAVKQAKKLVKKQKTDTKKVAAIYKWLSKKIKYDKQKAATVGTGYIPNPDTTLKTKKGICFDYASLAAAMMRSQGIPCKVMTGYVAPNDLYHSWNMIYVQNKGWISAELKASKGKYGRIDVTYAAAGAGKFVGNGKNYVNRYEY